jgi:uncharacterized protein with ATP-grasp and redox domains
MKTYYDCIPCLLRQSLDAVRSATTDEAIHERILREMLQFASQMDLRRSPAAMAQHIHRRVREMTGGNDPYREIKEHQNRLAWELYEQLQGRIRQSADPLAMAVRLAIAGNIIDLGAKSGLDESQIRREIAASLDAPFVGDVRSFAEAIAASDKILYLTDNAGEIIFDRLLIERLPREKVTVAVKGGPVINDATMVDAEAAKLTDLVNVMDNGSDAPGTILEDCSARFRRHFAEADLIIAKGQGNFETLWGGSDHGNIYFLLRIKCEIVARDLGVPVGRMVLRPSASLASALSPEQGHETNSTTIAATRECAARGRRDRNAAKRGG